MKQPTPVTASSGRSHSTLPPAPRDRVRFRIRTSAAIATGRAAGTMLRRLRLGGGTSLPGLVARYVDPHVTRRLGAQMRRGNIVVTGTNGKTTSSALVTSVCVKLACVSGATGKGRIWRAASPHR